MRMMLALTCLAAVSATTANAQYSEDVPAYPGCTWEDTVLAAPETSSMPDLALRIQRCDDPDMQISLDYAIDGMISEVFTDGYQMERIQVFHDPDVEAAALMRMVAEANVPEDERARCIFSEDEPGFWTYGPDGDYEAELNALNEPWEACGLFGEGAQVQFFKIIGAHTAVYVWAGQDLPLFDPRSIELAE